jgi:hypothetical protein
MADGTAQQCGRVGSCHILLKSPDLNGRDFFLLIFSCDICPLLSDSSALTFLFYRKKKSNKRKSRPLFKCSAKQRVSPARLLWGKAIRGRRESALMGRGNFSRGVKGEDGETVRRAGR